MILCPLGHVKIESKKKNNVYSIIWLIVVFDCGAWQYCHITQKNITMGKESYSSKGGHEKAFHCSSKMKKMIKKIEEFSLFFKSLEKMTQSASGFLKELFKLIKIVIGIISFICTILGISSAL